LRFFLTLEGGYMSTRTFGNTRRAFGNAVHTRSIKGKKNFAEKSKKTFRTSIEDSLRSNICMAVLKIYRSFLRSFKNGVFDR
jgi:hypothetical protein